MCSFWAGGISSFPFSRAREYRLLRRLETLNLKIPSGLWPSFLAPNKKEIPTALHASVIRLCLKYAYFCL
jgi:hypothetical protein